MKSQSVFNKALVIIAACMFILAGCGANKTMQSEGSSPSPEEEPKETKLKVVTTIYPIYDFTRNVAGEYAEVIPLIPPGAEPHGWEPTPQDMKTIEQADVFVYNGGMVEYWLEQVMGSIQNDKLVKVEAIEGLELMPFTHDHGHDHSHGHSHGHDHGGDAHDDEHGHDHKGESHGDEHGHNHEGDAHGKEHDHDNEEHGSHDHDHAGELDSHVWTDPVLAQKQVLNIMEGLAKADPAHKDDYKKNADEYITKLQELDQSFKEMTDTANRKQFVVQHAAFGYLAERYGLKQLPIAGLSPEQEPSPAQMAEIIQFVKDNEVGTIFFETLADPKIASVIAKDTGARTSVLNPAEGLTAEELQQNLDYIAIMKQNLNALQAALNE
ncbi:metal ABC transporter substrate-binding protein [Paenibacillus sp. J2TS4]|uniref:metal ABC transporter substrate-binding protein n=1 Tax=Paenibacillus sp. J2TS4 TaxID=2807194 RepID=UPI001B107FA7|nr:metal ABC transporter substrate-binding protein [Paenibacillus sp. J2TS4]GIP33184.1 high-affinity zinc uptake system binding-protein ZnuA [Paenibacillus sp. J2TS4]